MKLIRLYIWKIIYYILGHFWPKGCVSVHFRRSTGRWLNWRHPRDVNEKIQWLKFNGDTSQWTRLADKYAVREYVEKQGCGGILNDLYGYWTNADDIDFDKLPNKFVLKNNYFYHMNLVVTDKSKLDIEATRRLMAQWLKSNGHLYRSEMQYAAIPKKIIAEKYIETEDGQAPADYKIYCGNGKPLYVMVCIGREQDALPKFYYFDTKGNLQRELTKDGQDAPKDFHYDIPNGWDKMIAYAKKLSAPFPFVRADFYLEKGQVIFGELTFTPAAGLDAEKLPETDMLIGKQIELPR